LTSSETSSVGFVAAASSNVAMRIYGATTVGLDSESSAANSALLSLTSSVGCDVEASSCWDVAMLMYGATTSGPVSDSSSSISSVACRIAHAEFSVAISGLASFASWMGCVVEISACWGVVMLKYGATTFGPDSVSSHVAC